MDLLGGRPLLACRVTGLVLSVSSCSLAGRIDRGSELFGTWPTAAQSTPRRGAAQSRSAWRQGSQPLQTHADGPRGDAPGIADTASWEVGCCALYEVAGGWRPELSPRRRAPARFDRRASAGEVHQRFLETKSGWRLQMPCPTPPTQRLCREGRRDLGTSAACPAGPARAGPSRRPACGRAGPTRCSADSRFVPVLPQARS